MTKAALIEENRELKQQILILKDKVTQLQRMIFGKKSERFIPADNQLNLFTGNTEESEKKEDKAAKEISVPAHSRKVNKNHPGRSLLKNCEHLRVEKQYIETPHEEGDLYIGDQVREKLGYKRGEFFIKKIITPKHKSAKSGKIIIGDQPSEPIPKCEADVSLLSYIVVSKFVDHLPEYRLQKIFKRDGVVIPPSTMNGWVHRIADLFKPMASHIEQEILNTGYIQMDESTIKVLKTKKGKAHLGYMWVIYSPAMRCVRFIYHKGRGKEAPKEILKNYEGKLQCDGYHIYETIDKIRANISLSNCNAHARREFDRALSNDKDTASKALYIYQKLYKIERSINENMHTYEHLEDFYKYRQEERQNMNKHIADLKELIYNPPNHILPKSSIGKAILYTRNRWERLTKFIDDGELEIDTNLVENCIRPLALGRKNYLFAGNHEAAANIGVFYTIYNTCRHLGVNVTEYTTWYLNRINTIPINKIASLSPMTFKKFGESE